MFHSIRNKNKFVSNFAYIFLALFAFLAVACESNNDDNPLAVSTMEGYVADCLYWNTSSPQVQSFGRDSLGRDTILTIQGNSSIDGSELYLFIPYPEVSSFTVAPRDTTDTVGLPIPIIRYKGEDVPEGTINITRYDTVRYILEADFNFSFDKTTESDSGTVDTSSVEFTRGKIKAAYLRLR
ncbi:hypothetical protein WAF17_00865 [Bernardetia sp. ABR2-2B]|uniref:hypothetical protein n=1 Tax=Bernardetia sp. ABR2-2B TaxID=3127472 RepID=UPI0030D13044